MSCSNILLGLVISLLFPIFLHDHHLISGCWTGYSAGPSHAARVRRYPHSSLDKYFFFSLNKHNMMISLSLMLVSIPTLAVIFCLVLLIDASFLQHRRLRRCLRSGGSILLPMSIGRSAPWFATCWWERKGPGKGKEITGTPEMHRKTIPGYSRWLLVSISQVKLNFTYFGLVYNRTCMAVPWHFTTHVKRWVATCFNQPQLQMSMIHIYIYIYHDII